MNTANQTFNTMYKHFQRQVRKSEMDISVWIVLVMQNFCPDALHIIYYVTLYVMPWQLLCPVKVPSTCEYRSIISWTLHIQAFLIGQPVKQAVNSKLTNCTENTNNGIQWFYL